MIIKTIEIKLPEGKFDVETTSFDNKDDKLMNEIYSDWRALSNKLQRVGGRGVNLPETLSEAVFCRNTGSVRINTSIPGANSSFDCYNLTTKKRIQVKACSVLPDLTSFGPQSVWDELYFMDFFANGKWDGSINVYLIPNNLIYNHPVNKKQTMKDQQAEGRRPRFSIFKEIIQARKLKPIYEYKL